MKFAFVSTRPKFTTAHPTDPSTTTTASILQARKLSENGNSLQVAALKLDRSFDTMTPYPVKALDDAQSFTEGKITAITLDHIHVFK